MANMPFAGTLLDVEGLDLTTPYEVLIELRSSLTLAEISEMTGLRRETLSRARQGTRFQRRTAKALDDLNLVVTRLRPMLGGEATHVAAVLRRPQESLGGRSIAELLREDRVDVILEHLVAPARQLDYLRFSPELGAELQEAASRPSPDASRSLTTDDPAELIAADPELSAMLPTIEATIRDHFGGNVEIQSEVLIEPSNPDGRDMLSLRIRHDLSLDEAMDRLAELLEQEHDLLRPLVDRVTIGIL